jgi:hypothetical protein
MLYIQLLSLQRIIFVPVVRFISQPSLSAQLVRCTLAIAPPTASEARRLLEVDLL